MKNKVIAPVNYNNLLDRIADILVEARTKVVREINKAQVLAYWEIGREIIEFEHNSAHGVCQISKKPDSVWQIRTNARLVTLL